jgi:hypothetical protein
MFLENAQEKASQGAQLLKAYLQDVGDSIFGTVTSTVDGDGDWHQLCVDRHRREGCCGCIDIPSRRCHCQHRLCRR